MALDEDLGLAGDITTNATVAANATANAVIAARKPGVVAGLALAETAFRAIAPETDFTIEIGDGEKVKPGAVIARISGNARALLTAERVALNFLGRLSGIATLTRLYVDKVSGTHAKIVDTRKTTPGLRAFEKYAVRCGGGYNHRVGLFDAVLIKDNHIEIKYEDVFETAKQRLDAQFRMYSPQPLAEDQLAQYTVQFLQNKENANRIFDEVKGQKVIDYIRSIVTIDSKPITHAEFAKLA